MKYSGYNNIACNHGLDTLVFGSVSKIIDNYTCRPNGGEEVTGTRYEFPEFIVDGDAVTVTVHHVVWHQTHDITHHLWTSNGYLDTWDKVHEALEGKTGCLHRSKKSGLSMSRFVTGMCQSKDSTTISLATEAILRKLKCRVEELDVKWLTGDDLVEWYENNDGTSHSCMTGTRAESTRTWSTNPAQCRLAVFYNGDEPIARALCFRPAEPMEPLTDELQFGPGWYFGRLYPVRVRGTNTFDGVERATAFCERKGLLSVDHVSCAGGVVPLKMTEFAPYIDRGMLFYKSTTINTKVVFVPMASTRIREFEDWRETENNQWGSAWGRRMEQDTPDANCCCCEEGCDSEDITFVEGYGDICSNCLDGGDFTYCIDGAWRHNDDTEPIVCAGWRIDHNFAQSGRHSIRCYAINKTSGHGEYVRFVPAIVNDQSEHGYAPEVETVGGTADGKLIWKKLVDDGTFKLVSKMITIGQSGWIVDDCPPQYVAAEERTTVRIGLQDFDAMLAPSAFNWHERMLLCSPDEPVIILKDYRSSFFCLWLERKGQIVRYQRVGTDIVLVDYSNGGDVVWSTSTSRYSVGSRLTTIPNVSFMSHTFPVVLNGVNHGVMYSAAYSFGNESTMWAGSMYPSGYAWGCFHDSYNVRELLDRVCQPMLARRRTQVGHYQISVNDSGQIIDALYETDRKLFLVRYGVIVGMFNQHDNKVVMFYNQHEVGTIDQMIAFSTMVRNRDATSICNQYTRNPNMEVSA